MNTKINILQAIKIYKSNKDFIFFDLDKNNNIINFTLSNDMLYKNKFDNFRVLSCIKKTLKTLTI